MIQAARYAREQNIPYFGICLGMQIMVMEYARDVLGYADANSSEFTPDGEHNVIALMPDQQGNIPKGGTMRLGKYPCITAEGTKLRECYGKEEIDERHRHRYEFNNDYRAEMQNHGLVISGTSPDGRLNLIHIVTTAYFNGMFEPVRHRMDKARALHYIRQLNRYHMAGFETIFHPENFR